MANVVTVVAVPEVKECERLFSLVQPWIVDIEDNFCLRDSPWDSNSSSTERKNENESFNLYSTRADSISE